MANSTQYKDTTFGIGDMVTVRYRIKESENKERIQPFQGIVLKIRGMGNENRMITVRKMSHSGIGVERIFPLMSPFINDIEVDKRSSYSKARAYFIRNLSQLKLRKRIYRNK